MSIRYLLDTNVVSEPLRPKPSRTVLARLKEHQDELGIASVVWHELWFGCLRLPASARRTVIERYLDEVVAVSMPVVPYDQAAAGWHAAERARLSLIGRTPPFADGQIIAVASVHEMVLVTLNPADYEGFSGARVEDWSR